DEQGQRPGEGALRAGTCHGHLPVLAGRKDGGSVKKESWRIKLAPLVYRATNDFSLGPWLVWNVEPWTFGRCWESGNRIRIRGAPGRRQENRGRNVKDGPRPWPYVNSVRRRRSSASASPRRGAWPDRQRRQTARRA